MKQISVFLLFFFCCIYSTNALGERLKIGTIERPPFAYKEGSEWKGFSIDLWKDIALKNNFSYDFVEMKEFSKLISATKDKQVDASIANISITLEREKFIDFSQPIFDSGLNILASKGIIDQQLYLSSLVNNIGNIVIGLFVFLLGLTHFFWIYNVTRGNIYFFDYFKDIFPLFFQLISQIKELYGFRILLSFSVLACVFVVSYYSQKISYVFASHDKSFTENNISKYADIESSELSKVKIGVTEGSTSFSYLEKRNIVPKAYRFFDEMPEELKKGNIDIIIHDDPVLRYFAENKGKDKFMLVGKTFQPEKFGIAFPEKSPLIEKIDQTLLKIRESRKYEEIYDIYF